MVDYHEYIVIRPGVRSGKPCVKGTRITVHDVLEYMAGGMSVPEILNDFPQLSEESVRACFAYAADRERKMKIVA